MFVDTCVVVISPSPAPLANPMLLVIAWSRDQFFVLFVCFVFLPGSKIRAGWASGVTLRSLHICMWAVSSSSARELVRGVGC